MYIDNNDLFKGNRRESRDGSLENPIQEVRQYEICNLNTGTQKNYEKGTVAIPQHHNSSNRFQRLLSVSSPQEDLKRMFALVFFKMVSHY